jgi:hypothetical protein
MKGNKNIVTKKEVEEIAMKYVRENPSKFFTLSLITLALVGQVQRESARINNFQWHIIQLCKEHKLDIRFCSKFLYIIVLL